MCSGVGELICGINNFFDWSSKEKRVKGQLPEEYSEIDRVVELYAKFSFQERYLSQTKTYEEGKYEFKYIQYSKSFFRTESFIIKLYDVSGKNFITSINIELKRDDVLKNELKTPSYLERDKQFFKSYPFWPNGFNSDLAFLDYEF